MEREIEDAGLAYDNEEPLLDGSGRKYNDLWESKKIVSLFNLGIALELMLKLLLELWERERPNCHKLTRLYDGLPRKVQKELERAYLDRIRSALDSGKIVANIRHPSPRPDKIPTTKTPNISTLRGFLAFFDSQVSLSTKRYAWENAAELSWNYYIDNISLFVDLIDRVMYSLQDILSISSQKP